MKQTNDGSQQFVHARSIFDFPIIFAIAVRVVAVGKNVNVKNMSEVSDSQWKLKEKRMGFMGDTGKFTFDQLHWFIVNFLLLLNFLS